MRFVFLVIVALLAVVMWQDGAMVVEGTPTAGAYSTQAIVPDAYLGSAGASVIEFAMIPGRPNEAIVAQQSGYIWRVALDGSFAPVLWGDVHTKVTYGGEQGLLSVAFSPDFLTSGRVYLYYTPGSPTPTVLARYTATATDLNEASEEVLIRVAEFADNHNGGHIVFDSVGYLYLSLGDGGGGGDPNENGQRLTILLGKVIRIDVSSLTGYAIPADNPFAGGDICSNNHTVGGNCAEIFAYGFRNPFRTSIDPLTDQLWVGDVGQNLYEEVDQAVVKGGNYGWDCYEGNHPFESTGCSTDPSTFKFPRVEYDHSNGQAVTGGYVYRGTVMPELYGWYVYSDFYSGHIWAVNPADSSAPVLLTTPALNVSSFTLLPDGEIAIVSYDNGVYRLTGADSDGDGIVAASDNCPWWPNPQQNLPPWTVPNDDPDCDGWSWYTERFVTTDPTRRCMSTAPRNDEPLPDRWPVDLDDNQAVNGSDLLAFAPAFGGVAPNAPYDARFDVQTDGVINGSDLLKFAPFFYKSCT